MRRFIFTRPRVIVTVFFALIAMTSGCRRRAADTTSYNDPHPLPEEPYVFEAPSIGRHGGRFVIGQTVNPRTFNALMTNEQSSSDLVERMFIGLTQYDNAAQKRI